MSQYCVPSDVTAFALPSTAVTTPITNADCIAASAEADSYMRARYALPLSANYPIGGPYTTFDPALVRHTAYIVAYMVMSKRGFAPNAGSDALILANYFKAVGDPEKPGSGWFPGVERGHIHPDVVEASVPAPRYQLPQVLSKPPRGI